MTAPFRFDAPSGLLTWGDCAAQLTRQHSKFVSILAAAYPRCVAAKTVIDIVWGDHSPADPTLSLRALAYGVRERMDDAGMPATIFTLHGLGHIWRGEIELIGDAPLLVPTADAADLARLLDTHPNVVLADRVRWAVFGV